MPRFYLDLLEREVRQRRFRWHHPFNQRPMELSLAPDQSAVLVLWSKDFGPYLRRRKAFEGWPLFFHFTITTPVSFLEPDLPPLSHRLDQLERLVAAYGPRAVRWRFDPIVCWEQGGVLHDNLGSLDVIAARVAAAGLRDVTVSLMDRYRKIDRRVSSTPLTFRYLSEEEQATVFAPRARILQSMGFTIHTCCEPALTAILGVRPGRCIDAELLTASSGLPLRVEPDGGQRRHQGCGCHRSIDIGCYAHHRCLGQCLYCYARP
ncbi:DUF1848 family protein [Candidatus Fermentibacteria bacterium]|nr:DUF1848 family protein [Candidatus Fermentibacteria bacterium]